MSRQLLTVPILNREDAIYLAGLIDGGYKLSELGLYAQLKQFNQVGTGGLVL